MPLTDPQAPQQFWPPQGCFAQPQAQDNSHVERLHNFVMQQTDQLQKLTHVLDIQREAFCRLLGIEEAKLIAHEKAILKERTRPAPEVTAEGVQTLITTAIEQNNQVIRGMLTEFAASLRNNPNEIQDPMTLDDLPDNPEDDDAIEMN